MRQHDPQQHTQVKSCGCVDSRHGSRKSFDSVELFSAPRRRRSKKVLQSAIANAENNHNMDVDKLIVAEAYVGKALVMKRWQARARGRAGRVEKMFSNLTVVVRENEENR